MSLDLRPKINTVRELKEYLNNLDDNMELVEPNWKYEGLDFSIGITPYIRLINDKEVLAFD